MRKHLPLAETGDAPAEFYISGPADIVRPRLARWKAESARFYLQSPRVIVGKYELDALAPILRLARRKPAVGAALLMPYLAQEVAHLMAEWLVRSRQFSAPSPRTGPPGTVPAAPRCSFRQPWARRQHGHEPQRSRWPARYQRSPRGSGRDGCRDAVEALLGRDPLDLVPARIPAVPKWADPEPLPQVLLADRRDALPSDATGALLRMIAMSQLDAPYEGLSVIAGHCDRSSLSNFAWSLYRLWEAEGRPSKEAWAMDCLGCFGDDDRCGPARAAGAVLAVRRGGRRGQTWSGHPRRHGQRPRPGTLVRARAQRQVHAVACPRGRSTRSRRFRTRACPSSSMTCWRQTSDSTAIRSTTTECPIRLTSALTAS